MIVPPEPVRDTARRSLRRGVLALFLTASLPGVAASSLVDRLADPETAPYRITGAGFVTDAGHPRHPGDFLRAEVVYRLSVDPELDEGLMELESEVEKGKKRVERYFFRRGRIFTVGEDGAETTPSSYRDLSVAAVAALHPVLVAAGMRERRENLRWGGGRSYVFAWNDELWNVTLSTRSGRIRKLEHRVHHDVFGDDHEEVRYESWPTGAGPLAPGRVVVTGRGREIARIDFREISRDSVAFEVPGGDHARDRSRVVADEEIALHEIAPHLYRIDLDSMNTRVMVAEFADHLAVLEGAYNSRICDRIAQKVRVQLGKPVRYFAFSHLHGQYVGGTRSWVHEGATVLVPPTTAPLIEEIVKGRHVLQPDALARDPQPLRIETIADRRRLEDGANVLEIYNLPSGASEHTDEYLLFYFPRAKVLLTGDLLFYRPGQPLTGRSKKLCETVRKLGIEVETYLPTWPLTGYGTKNIVTAAEVQGACEPN